MAPVACPMPGRGRSLMLRRRAVVIIPEVIVR